MSDRARLGGIANARKREPYRRALMEALGQGHNLKQAAYLAGVSYRSARRYRAAIQRQAGL